MADDTLPPLITFAEAEQLGGDLHDHWATISGGDAPLAREDMAWADIVQFVLRRASDVVRARPEPTDGQVVGGFIAGRLRARAEREAGQADIVDSAGQAPGGTIARYLGGSGNPGHVLARRGKSGAE